MFSFFKQVVNKEPNPNQANAHPKAQVGSFQPYPSQLTKADSGMHGQVLYRVLTPRCRQKPLSLEGVQMK